jgi:hypothetical protein
MTATAIIPRCTDGGLTHEWHPEPEPYRSIVEVCRSCGAKRITTVSADRHTIRYARPVSAWVLAKGGTRED